MSLLSKRGRTTRRGSIAVSHIGQVRLQDCERRMTLEALEADRRVRAIRDAEDGWRERVMLGGRA